MRGNESDLSALARQALTEHVERREVQPVLLYEHAGRCRRLRLPAGDHPPAAAGASLRGDDGEDRRFQRAAVVWRCETGRGDIGGRAVPVRYVRTQAHGEPTSCLYVQHYSVSEDGERPIGGLERVERGEPLTAGRAEREIADHTITAAAGALAGFAGAYLALWFANLASPATEYLGTIREPAAAGPVHVETPGGRTIDLGTYASDVLRPELTPGTGVRVEVADLTGATLEVSTSDTTVNLATAAWPWVTGALGAAVVAPMIAVFLTRRYRQRSLWVAAVAAFAAHAVYLLVF